MANHRKTARGRIENKGPRPKFTGWVSTTKAGGGLTFVSDGMLGFRSLSEMMTILFLIWCKTVHWIVYEAAEEHGRWPDC